MLKTVELNSWIHPILQTHTGPISHPSTRFSGSLPSTFNKILLTLFHVKYYLLEITAVISALSCHYNTVNWLYSQR